MNSFTGRKVSEANFTIKPKQKIESKYAYSRIIVMFNNVFNYCAQFYRCALNFYYFCIS